MPKSPLILEEDLIKNEKIVDTFIVEEKVNSKIPNDYIPIKLSTLGKLSAPKVLYFRDYSMDDALELNVLDEEDQLKALTNTLTSMSYEGFDCKKLHIKELMEILFTIHGTFIGNKIEKEYHLDEDLDEGTEEGQRDHPDNIKTIEVNLTKITTRSIDETDLGKTQELKFKEPFTLTDNVKKIKMQFKLTRVGDLLYAQTYCNEKYEEEIQKFKPLKKALYKLNDIKNKADRKVALDNLIESREDEYDEYYNFMIRYDKDYIRVLQSQTIISVNGKVLETIEEKLEAYKTNISETLWQRYNQVTTQYDFGIVENYSFYCDALQKNITRGFLFQYMDFLPNSDKEYGSRYMLSFD